ncbi:Holliday junction resolvase RuvX [Deinococcus pimensis]|uniref:Holliday junction resolvase RuvX n=1 Tax=Deinococcus pimensis TaxID=309888 RepID=UPI0004818981|nr:Holliday junction resolvase RuvX [Deinococcus pimensis]
MTDSPIPRVLALDVSQNRVGFAVNVGSLAFGRGSLRRTKHARDLKAILEKMREEGAEALVLGLPLRTDGQPSDAARRVRSFGFELTRAGATVHYQDERFTTRRAREAGASDLDEAAAVEILRLWLQRSGQ